MRKEERKKMTRYITVSIYNILLPLQHGHVHKYEAAFGYGVDILMAVTFLSIVLFQKLNQEII